MEIITGRRRGAFSLSTAQVIFTELVRAERTHGSRFKFTLSAGGCTHQGLYDFTRGDDGRFPSGVIVDAQGASTAPPAAAPPGSVMLGVTP